MIVVGGSASSALSRMLSRELGVSMAKVETKRFPDLECYVRILEPLDSEDVVLVQNSYPDDNIIELFLLQDAILEFNINSLVTVVPYFGYARQDRKFNAGEPISAKTMAGHLGLSTDSFITVDIHKESVLSWFSVPAMNISGMPQIGEYLKSLAPDIIIAPDKGALDLARSVAESTGCSLDHLEKTRIDGENVSMKAKNLSVSGKRVVIVDDIIATGGTIMRAAEHLKAQGAAEVHAACTHGLFAKNALPKLKEVCDSVISSDTLENETSVVSVAPEIAKAIARK